MFSYHKRVFIHYALVLMYFLFIGRSDAFGEAAKSFASHRAYYQMSLGQSARNSGIIDVNGRMMFEWVSNCDSWTVGQRYTVRYYFSNGEMNETNTQYSSWESKDGKNFRFHVTNDSSNGKPTKLSGSASLTGNNLNIAKFTAPKLKNFILPPSTMFPSTHSFFLIDSALSGKRFINMAIFDGSELEGAISTSVVIGPKKVSQSKTAKMLSGPYWPIRMAFFSDKADQLEPDYEISVEMQLNGVSKDLVLDYGNFTVNVDLLKVESVKSPPC